MAFARTTFGTGSYDCLRSRTRHWRQAPVRRNRLSRSSRWSTSSPRWPLAPGTSSTAQIEQINLMVVHIVALPPPSDDADALARRIRGRLDRMVDEMGETAG